MKIFWDFYISYSSFSSCFYIFHTSFNHISAKFEKRDVFVMSHFTRKNYFFKSCFFRTLYLFELADDLAFFSRSSLCLILGAQGGGGGWERASHCPLLFYLCASSTHFLEHFILIEYKEQVGTSPIPCLSSFAVGKKDSVKLNTPSNFLVQYFLLFSCLSCF